MRAVIILAIIGAALAVPQNPQRIVGGESTTIDAYPFMANLQYLWFGIIWSQSCGGSLITTGTVLSAAHCFVGDSHQQWRVLLGTSFASSGGQVFNLQRIINHERYNQPTPLDNDIAVLWLASPVTLTANIQTIPIAGANYGLADNTPVTTIGWGTLTPGGSSPEQLQKVDIFTINQQVCFDRYFQLKNTPGFAGWPDITDRMLCAGILDVGGKDACQGDSGGPLVHGNVLVGVVSWGYSCADPVYPGVNARVSALSPWIVANGQ